MYTVYIHIVVRYKFELDLMWLSSLKSGLNTLFGHNGIRFQRFQPWLIVILTTKVAIMTIKFCRKYDAGSRAETDLPRQVA